MQIPSCQIPQISREPFTRECLIDVIKDSFNWFTLLDSYYDDDEVTIITDRFEGVLLTDPDNEDSTYFLKFETLSDTELADIIEFDDNHPHNIGNFPRDIVNHHGDEIKEIIVVSLHDLLGDNAVVPKAEYQLIEPKENQEVFC